MQREIRYIVIKRKHLNPLQETVLRHNLAEAGVEPIAAAVVEHDWPEYEAVWAMVEARVDGTAAPAAYLYERGEQGGPRHPDRGFLWEAPTETSRQMIEKGYTETPLYRWPDPRIATLQATVERQAAEIARLRDVLLQIAARNQVREWTAVSGKTDAEWVYYDGQYAKIARQALGDHNG